MPSTFVPYDIVYCSSEDALHPVTGLVGHSSGSLAAEDDTPGWQSASNARVPQTLVLRFAGNVRLDYIRLLCHESKIASTVEVRTYKLLEEQLQMPPSFRAARFTKLGVVDFSTNVQSHYCAKERKTVHVRTDAYFLKLLFGRPYTNEHNAERQVGLYSITCHGQLIRPVPSHVDRALAMQRTPSVSANNKSEESAAAGGAVAVDVRAEHSIDSSAISSAFFGNEDAVQVLSSPPFPRSPQEPLQAQPPFARAQHHAAAAGPPNHDVASHRAGTGESRDDRRPPGVAATEQDAMAAVGMTAAYDAMAFRSVPMVEFEAFFIARTEELLLLKEQAIAVDDFELATACRNTLRRLSAQTQRVYALEQDKVQAIIEERFSAAQEAKEAMDALIVDAQRRAVLPAPRLDGEGDEAHLTDDIRVMSAVHRETNVAGETRATSSVIGENDHAIARRSPSRNSAVAVTAVSESRDDEVVRLTAEGNSHELVVADLPAPEQELAAAILALTDDEARVSVPDLQTSVHTHLLLGSVGRLVTACLLARPFKLREAALLVVTERLTSTFAVNAPQVEDAVLRFLDYNNYGLQDAIPNVVFAACSFVRLALADPFGCLATVVVPLVTLLPRLLTRMADGVPRMRDEALATLTLYVTKPLIPAAALLAAALADPIDLDRRTRPASHPRVQLARLTLVQLLLDHNRLHLEAGTGSSALFHRLLLPSVNHQSRSVRDVATALLTALVTGKKLAVKAKDAQRINNVAIRELVLRSQKTSKTTK